MYGDRFIVWYDIKLIIVWNGYVYVRLVSEFYIIVFGE